MSEQMPAELLKARSKIDQIDRQLVELLAVRFQLTLQVGLLKADQGLAAFDESREAQQLDELRELCQEQGLDSEFITELFKRIMEEVVKNHNKLKDVQHQLFLDCLPIGISLLECPPPLAMRRDKGRCGA